MSITDDRARLTPDALLHTLRDAGADVSNPKSIRCPFHDDSDPSAGIFRGDDGAWRFKCHGCDAKGDYLDIRQRIDGTPPIDTVRATQHTQTKPRSTPTPAPVALTGPTRSPGKAYPTQADAEQAATYGVQRQHDDTWAISHLYTYPDGFVVLRLEPHADGSDAGGKTFRPIHRHDAGWSMGDPPGKLPLYRRDDLPPESADGPVLVVEGEKAADAAASIGLNVVAASHGSKAADKTDWTPLHVRDVVVWPDHDANGQAFAQRVAELVPGTRIMPVPDGLAEHDDIADWIDQHDAQTPDELRDAVTAMMAQAPAADPAQNELHPLTAGPSPRTPLGHRTPDGHLVLSPTQTLPTALAFVAEHYRHGDHNTLVCFAGELLVWVQNAYRPIEDGAVRRAIGCWLHTAKRYNTVSKGEPELVDFEANPRTVDMALSSIRDLVHLDATTTMPKWLDGRESPPAHEILPCKSVNFHLPTGTISPATPALFSTTALEFDPVDDPPEPVAWLTFLSQLWADDADSIACLQEMFGYLLSGSTALQKMFLLVGPKRSGKGTIGRVLRQLIGKANVAGPTISSLAGAFGCQSLIGKSLAVVSDARFKGEGIHRVVERLLCISGEDLLDIERKHKTSVAMTLPTRFLFLTNEIPRFADASGALAGRFIALVLTESFYGREDPGLLQRLTAELPGILAWSIEGQRRLAERGYLIQPASGADEMQEMADMASPISAFIRDKCVVEPGERVMVDLLWGVWKTWCETEGSAAEGTKAMFGRDLKAAVPKLSKRRGTGMETFYQGIGVNYA